MLIWCVLVLYSIPYSLTFAGQACRIDEIVRFQLFGGWFLSTINTAVAFGRFFSSWPIARTSDKTYLAKGMRVGVSIFA
jgi:hypothetical protein